ncbi:hypothetical protein GGS23DRAFT_598292 [Durotheca rogersii]|uniref:uncharacterized protein n=1 Tax=Durotheca rogersii TaxID=419775 RepID=UPI0022206E7F|nr:uncharacterized protein GGS23DRAFT_598292 [Durotheca rogersii]KAI5861513.1 hypothetical protein GGS23DRAFT_598292 [Durotheca rogersii]
MSIVWLNEHINHYAGVSSPLPSPLGYYSNWSCLYNLWVLRFRESDTARLYVGGQQEGFTRQAVWKERGLSIVTKVWPLPAGSQEHEALTRAFETSLRVLGADSVDVLGTPGLRSGFDATGRRASADILPLLACGRDRDDVRAARLGAASGVAIGFSNLHQLTDNLSYLEKGPLDDEIVEVLEGAWGASKGDMEPYWQMPMVYGYDTEKALFGPDSK